MADVQGHIGQQPLDAVPSFGGSTTSGTESSYRLWDPSKVPSPRKIVAALDKFVVGQEATKKVSTPTNITLHHNFFSHAHTIRDYCQATFPCIVQIGMPLH